MSINILLNYVRLSIYRKQLRQKDGLLLLHNFLGRCQVHHQTQVLAVKLAIFVFRKPTCQMNKEGKIGNSEFHQVWNQLELRKKSDFSETASQECWQGKILIIG